MAEEKSRVEAAKEALLRTLENKVLENMDCVSVEELNSVTDAIKDMAEAEKLCQEAEYYKAVVKAMEEHEDDDDEEERRMYYTPTYRPYRMGYDPMTTTYSSTGAMGYNEVTAPYLDNMWRMEEKDPDADRYGRAFSEYRKARKHYTETKSDAAKSEMESMAGSHLNNTVSSIKEMWNSADNTLKMKIKNDLAKLVGEMNI